MTQPASIEPHLWRSPLLCAPHELVLSQGRIEYFTRGDGPAIVFAHGWGVNANLWRRVVDRLSDRFRCIALDLPFGAHRVPLGEHADLSPQGCGRLIGDILEALDVRDATLVGNDSGGAYSQIAVSQRPDRVGRLVLNSCETPYDEFPPPPFTPLPQVAKDMAALKAAYEGLRNPAARLSPVAYGLLAKHPLEQQASDSYALPPSCNDGVLRDVAKVMSSARSEPVHTAGQSLIESFAKPVLFAWSKEDPVFPLANARRYAAALKDGRVAVVEDAFSFTPEDQPVWLADTIAGLTPLAAAA